MHPPTRRAHLPQSVRLFSVQEARQLVTRSAPALGAAKPNEAIWGGMQRWLLGEPAWRGSGFRGDETRRGDGGLGRQGAWRENNAWQREKFSQGSVVEKAHAVDRHQYNVSDTWPAAVSPAGTEWSRRISVFRGAPAFSIEDARCERFHRQIAGVGPNWSSPLDAFPARAGYFPAPQLTGRLWRSDFLWVASRL